MAIPFTILKKNVMLVHTFNPDTQMAEAGSMGSR